MVLSLPCVGKGSKQVEITQDQIDGRPVSPSALQGLVFESVGGRVSVEVVRNVRIFGGYARDTNNQDDLATKLGRRYGIPSVAFRYSIVQGPRQSFRNAYSGALRSFTVALGSFSSWPVRMWNSGLPGAGDGSPAGNGGVGGRAVATPPRDR